MRLKSVWDGVGFSGCVVSPRDGVSRSAPAVVFDYVDQLSNHSEAPIARADLSNFSFEGRRAPRVSQKGIFNPAVVYSAFWHSCRSARALARF
jgi:hypothetical protein